MKKLNRPITEVIIHCTATPVWRALYVADITRYHRQRGFETIGYHYLITLDGAIHEGRPQDFVGAHCLGHNDHSLGIAYVGGIDAGGSPTDTRTPMQRAALRTLVARLLAENPGATVHGHNEFSAKACPCFDVAAEYHDFNHR